MAPFQSIEAESDSLEEARKQINSKIPEGFSIRAENVISDGKPKVIKAIAETMNEAYTKAQNEVPIGATITEKKELAQPDRKVVTIEAFDEQTAQAQAKSKIESTAVIKGVRLTTSGSKGFLGVGKRPNQYEVEVLDQAVVEITYKTKARIVARIGMAKAKSSEHYMLKCKNCGFTHHIPRDVADRTVQFSVDVDDVTMACVYGGGAFTVTLNVKEFFTIACVPESRQVLFASIVDNMKPLHGHILSHHDPLFLIIEQSSNRTTHEYRKQPEGDTFVKFSKEHGVDIVGNINISKAEIPGVS